MSIPHGGNLVDRFADPALETALLEAATHLPRIQLTGRDENDLQLIANGALSPLTGFMNREDYERVLQEMRLANGLPWSIPVTLAAPQDNRIEVGQNAALVDRSGVIRGTIAVEEIFAYDARREAQLVYGTADEAHPGVANLYAREPLHVGGPVTVFSSQRDDLSLTPRETRGAFRVRGWKSIVGFQTRNPVHRAHEYIQKCALEAVDGLLLHPLVGETKSDDIPADVRLRCYNALLDNYYPKDRVLLSTLPAAMRYAGPREAIFHALIRKNYGCTHFIVGRDHAGVGNYYGTYDAQKLFERFAPSELGIVPLKFENSFYCRRCEGMASRKTCSHDERHHVSLSGSAVRALLREGKLPPPEFSRPEVAQILIEAERERVPA